MLQSVKRAFAIDSSHPWLHECMIRLFNSGKFLFPCCTNLTSNECGAGGWFTGSDFAAAPEDLDLICRTHIKLIPLNSSSGPSSAIFWPSMPKSNTHLYTYISKSK